MANTIRIKRSSTNAASTLTAVPFGEMIVTDLAGDGLCKLFVGDSTETGANAVQVGTQINGNSSTFLDGTGNWSTPGGSGDVSKVGTPVDNQVGVWTGNGTIEGDAALTFDTASDTLSVGTNDSAAGTLNLYGNGTTGGGQLSIFNGASVDTKTNTWFLTTNASGDFNFLADATSLFTIDETTKILAFNATYNPKIGANDILDAGDIGTSVQGYDAGLAYLDGLNFTNEATFKQGVNLEIGVDVQAYNANNALTSDVTYERLNTNGDIETDVSNNTASTIPSTQAVKAYVDNAVASEMTYKGGYNAATNTPDLDTSPSGVAVGDMYTVTVAGTFFATAVEVGDVLIAEQDNATLESHWTIVNKNLDSVASSGITLTAGIGLVGGGDLTANRTFDLNFNELTAQTTGATTDEIAVQLTGNGAFRKMTVANFLDGGTF